MTSRKRLRAASHDGSGTSAALTGDPAAAPPVTRRERRAAEREARRRSGPVRPSGQGGLGSRPLLLLSTAGVIVGVLAVAVLVTLSGGLGGSGLPAVAAAAAPAAPAAMRDGRSLGDPAAPVHIEIYEDPQCVACALYFETIEPLLVYGPVKDGQVRLTYRDFIIFGQESIDAAVGMRAAEALGGRFWDFHDIVFANHAGEDVGAFSRGRLAEMAALIGIDRADFLARLDDPELIAAVLEESDGGRARGIDSTPTLVIDGVLYPGVPSWEQLAARIDEAAAVAG